MNRVVERFWAKVRPAAAGSCWEWADKPDVDGYGRLLVRGVSNLRAHRISAALFLPNIMAIAARRRAISASNSRTTGQESDEGLAERVGFEPT